MTAPVYGVTAGANVALAAGTPKTVLSVLAGAAFGLELAGLDFGSLGVTATDVPMQIELCKWTGAAAGTPAGSAVIVQQSGLIIDAGFTAFYGYTVEPSVLTVVRRITLTPNSGTLVVPLLDQEIQCANDDGLAVRVTAPAVVNIVPGIQVKRI